MKKTKKLAAILAALTAVSIIAGCSGTNSGETDGGGSTTTAKADTVETEKKEDDTEDTTTGEESTAPVEGGSFIYYCRTNASRESAPDNQAVLAHIEEQTGIKMEINAIAQESFKEKIDLMIASTDIFDGMNLVGYGDTYTDLQQRGAIMPINDLIDQYGDNIKSVMEPGLASCTDKDGNIWALPRAERFSQGYVPMIRGDWLAAMEMDMPSTIEELEAYFEAVQATDLNGNGENDEIPYLPNMLLYGISNYIPYYLSGTEGKLTSTGFSNLTNSKGLRYMDEDGTIRSVLTHPDFINIIAKFREWYEKGYMPKDIHLLKTAQLTDIRTTGVAGSLGGWFSDGNNPIIDWNSANPDQTPGIYEAIPPLKNAPGSSKWPSNPNNTPQILFMKNGKNTDAMMRYFNWLCESSQNTTTAQFGIEGTHWNWVDGEDNMIQVTPEAANYIEFYALANLYWEGLMPTVKVSEDNQSEFMRDIQMKTIRQFESNYPFDSFVTYNYQGTDAEYLTADGATLMEEAITKMVIGEMDLSEWDSVVANYNAIEGDILSQVWTDQYNEYNAG